MAAGAAALAQKLLTESFLAIELLHLLRDADPSALSSERVTAALQAAPNALRRFEDEYRSVEIAWMAGTYIRSLFNLTCLFANNV